jgi:hypothetical protein
MSPRRIVLAVELVLGCSLVVGSLVALRRQRVAIAAMAPTIRSEEAARIYRQRIQATNVLLKHERLSVTGL